MAILLPMSDVTRILSQFEHSNPQGTLLTISRTIGTFTATSGAGFAAFFSSDSSGALWLDELQKRCIGIGQCWIC